MKYDYEAHLGVRGNRRCLIPGYVAADQKAYDGRTFIAIAIDNCCCRRFIRVRLVGSDYGLDTPGTGDMIVRPIRWLDLAPGPGYR